MSDRGRALVDDFDAWATLAVRLLAREPDEAARLLADAEVERGAWDGASMHWAGVMAAGLDGGAGARAREYGARCAEEMRRRVHETDAAAQARTVELGAVTTELACAGPALPFGTAPPPTKLTLEQYAQLRAELAAFPERKDEVSRRLGLHDDEERCAVDEAWSLHLARDPVLRKRWLDLCAEHRARLPMSSTSE